MNKLDRIQDAHLDSLIRLAYAYQDAMEAEALSQESKRPLSAEERARRAAGYARFQEDLRAENARARRERIARNWRKHARRIVQVAACIVLILGIATPIAIATVDSVRAKVLQFLIDVQSDHTELSLVEDEAAAFDVPEGWQGSYFPSRIPEGYCFHGMSRAGDYVEYANSDGDTISFDECTQDSFMDINSENAELSYEPVNGALAFVADGETKIVTWANDERYFVVMSSLSKQQALEFAKNVRKIVKY